MEEGNPLSEESGFFVHQAERMGLEFNDGADLGAVILIEVAGVGVAVQPVVVEEILVPRGVATVLGRRPEVGTCSYLCTTDKIKSIVNG